MGKSREKRVMPAVGFWFMLHLLPGIICAQTTEIHLITEPEHAGPNETVTLRFSLPEVTDAFYFSVEVTHDTSRFTFTGSDPGQLMMAGLHIYGTLAESRIGASVSKTGPAGVGEPGDLLEMHFQVREQASPGISTFTLENAELYDSAGEPVAYTLPAQIPFEIDTLITAHRHTVAEWRFDSGSLMPDRALFANRFRPFSVHGVNLPVSFPTGASGQAASVSGWSDPNTESYWMVSVRTMGLRDLTLSSRQSGSNTGPRTFRLEGSLDGESWTPVPGGGIIVENNWTSGRLEELPLPADYEDRELIHLRWLQTGEEQVDTSGTAISSAGTNRIDDVVIRGEQPDPLRVGVWPGDANRDGVVDQEDVLEIANYWLAAGPVPLYPDEEWAERDVEQWIPAEATFADTDGDGVVNHRDLRLIGRHFGQTRPGGKVFSPELAIADLVIGPEDLSDGAVVVVAGDPEGGIAGVAYRLELSGMGEGGIDRIEPGGWADIATEAGEWIHFEHVPAGPGSVAGAMAVTGRPAEMTGPELFTLRLHPVSEPGGPLVVRLLQLARSFGPGSVVPADEAVIYLRQDDPDPNEPEPPPAELRLFQNYPNPVYSETRIGYQLPRELEIRLELFDLTGRRVKQIAEGVVPAGRYEVSLQMSHLAAGLYLYRLTTPERVMSQKLLLLK